MKNSQVYFSLVAKIVKNLSKGGKVEYITTYKPILLRIPKSANVIISASTRYGKINSDFPVYLDKEDKNKIRVELGDGQTAVNLKTSGNITIKKD